MQPNYLLEGYWIFHSTFHALWSLCYHPQAPSFYNHHEQETLHPPYAVCIAAGFLTIFPPLCFSSSWMTVSSVINNFACNCFSLLQLSRSDTWFLEVVGFTLLFNLTSLSTLVPWVGRTAPGRWQSRARTKSQVCFRFRSQDWGQRGYQ